MVMLNLFVPEASRLFPAWFELRSTPTIIALPNVSNNAPSLKPSPIIDIQAGLVVKMKWLL